MPNSVNWANKYTARYMHLRKTTVFIHLTYLTKNKRILNASGSNSVCCDSGINIPWNTVFMSNRTLWSSVLWLWTFHNHKAFRYICCVLFLMIRIDFWFINTCTRTYKMEGCHHFGIVIEVNSRSGHYIVVCFA